MLTGLFLQQLKTGITSLKMVVVVQFLLLAIEMLQMMHSVETNASDSNSCCTTEHYEMYLRSSDKMTKVDQHRCVMRPSNLLRRVAHCCCQATFVLESVGYGVEYYFTPEYGCVAIPCPNSHES